MEEAQAFGYESVSDQSETKPANIRDELNIHCRRGSSEFRV
jgi:hypothetical protein